MHASMDDPPDSTPYVPMGHGVHVSARFSEYVPGAHGTHAAPAPPPDVPAGQSVHDVAPIVASNTDPGPLVGARSVRVVLA
jgi:hypothetical protein|tara:strand:+ start:1321 stop:1563 length:243 start_codon:yes stop_codon:yes gene_type:complete